MPILVIQQTQISLQLQFRSIVILHFSQIMYHPFKSLRIRSILHRISILKPLINRANSILKSLIYRANPILKPLIYRANPNLKPLLIRAILTRLFNYHFLQILLIMCNSQIKFPLVLFSLRNILILKPLRNRAFFPILLNRAALT